MSLCLSLDGYADICSSCFAPIHITKVSLITRHYCPLRLLIHVALYGAKFLETLCDRNLAKLTPSKTLNQMYAAGLLHPTREVSRKAMLPTEKQSEAVAALIHAERDQTKGDVALLRRWNGKLLAEKFHLPGMELEIERAVEQVEKSIHADLELLEGRTNTENPSSKTPSDRKKG